MLQFDKVGDVFGARHIQHPNVIRNIIRTPLYNDINHLKNLIGLQHKHVVPLHEVFCHSGNLFFTYEMMHISLKDLTACNLRLNESQVAKICRDVVIHIRAN